jgi:hypothetical protein
MIQVRVASDLVKATFSNLDPLKRFPVDIPKIYSFFNKYSKIDRFKDLFEGFNFDNSQSYPFCETLDKAFDRLQKSNLLSCINPSLNQFEISAKLANQKEEIKKIFNEIEGRLIKELAQAFETEIIN